MEDVPLIDHSKCHSFIDTVVHLDEDDGHSHDHHHHEHSHGPSNLSLKLIIIIVLTAIFFLAELVTGFITKSLSLQSDSFHMLSDLASLIIGLIAHNLAKKKPTNAQTFGWARAEVLGGLVNSVFLMAICLTILFEAIMRFINVEKIEQPDLFLIVGGLGLLVNVIGIFFLGGHNHSDNIRGIFLHVLGDFFGSIAVMISACVVKWTDWKYKDYIDPVISLLILGILVYGSAKLFMKTSKTVLESTPSDINIDLLREDLMNIEGMVAVHELHVWQLSNNNYISTCHVVVDSKERNQQVHADSTNIFMKHQIFSSTIQIEFVDDFPTGVNHVGSCFYASTLCNNKRCFVTPPVYQHHIGCPHINLADIEGTDEHDHDHDHDHDHKHEHDHDHGHKHKKKENVSNVKMHELSD